MVIKLHSYLFLFPIVFPYLKYVNSQCNTALRIPLGVGLSEVVSPGWLDGYDPNLNCTWIFDADPEHYILFKISNDVDCGDKLSVYNGDDLIQDGICFDTFPVEAITSPGKSLTVNFVTDGQTNPDELGFVVQAITAKDEFCGMEQPLVVSETEKSFTSKNFPNGYQPNTICEFTLIPSDPTKRIQIKFPYTNNELQEFYEDNLLMEKCLDKVEVFEESTKIGEACARGFPDFPITFTGSNGAFMRVVFRANNKTEERGFKATHVLVAPLTTTTSMFVSGPTATNMFPISTTSVPSVITRTRPTVAAKTTQTVMIKLTPLTQTTAKPTEETSTATPPSIITTRPTMTTESSQTVMVQSTPLIQAPSKTDVTINKDQLVNKDTSMSLPSTLSTSKNDGQLQVKPQNVVNTSSEQSASLESTVVTSPTKPSITMTPSQSSLSEESKTKSTFDKNNNFTDTVPSSSSATVTNDESLEGINVKHGTNMTSQSGLRTHSPNSVTENTPLETTTTDRQNSVLNSTPEISTSGIQGGTRIDDSVATSAVHTFTEMTFTNSTSPSDLSSIQMSGTGTSPLPVNSDSFRSETLPEISTTQSTLISTERTQTTNKNTEDKTDIKFSIATEKQNLDTSSTLSTSSVPQDPVTERVPVTSSNHQVFIRVEGTPPESSVLHGMTVTTKSQSGFDSSTSNPEPTKVTDLSGRGVSNDPTDLNDLGFKASESSASSNDIGVKAPESGSSSHDLGLKASQSGKSTNDLGLKAPESGSSNNFGFNASESETSTNNLGFKASESGSSNDLGSKASESGKSNDLGLKASESGSSSKDLGLKAPESGSSNNFGFNASESETSTNNLGFKASESGSSNDLGSKASESGTSNDVGLIASESGKSNDLGLKASESGSSSNDLGFKASESGSSNDLGFKVSESGTSNDLGLKVSASGKSNDLGLKASASGKSTNDPGFKPSESGSSTNDLGFKASESGSSNDLGFKASESGSSNDLGFKASESGSSNDLGFKASESGSSNDLGFKASESGSSNDLGFKASESGKSTNDPGFKPSESGSSTNDLGFIASETVSPRNDLSLKTLESGSSTNDLGFIASETVSPRNDLGLKAKDSGSSTDDLGFIASETVSPRNDLSLKTLESGSSTNDLGFIASETVSPRNDLGLKAKDSGSSTDDLGFIASETVSPRNDLGLKAKESGSSPNDLGFIASETVSPRNDLSLKASENGLSTNDLGFIASETVSPRNDLSLKTLESGSSNDLGFIASGSGPSNNEIAFKASQGGSLNNDLDFKVSGSDNDINHAGPNLLLMNPWLSNQQADFRRTENRVISPDQTDKFRSKGNTLAQKSPEATKISVNFIEIGPGLISKGSEADKRTGSSLQTITPKILKTSRTIKVATRNISPLANGQKDENGFPKGSHTVCEKGWIKHGDRCYFLSRNRETWFNSQLMCYQLRSTLASVQSKSEGVFLENLARNYAYIGCYKDWLSNRLLPIQNFYQNMTNGWCVDRCRVMGFQYAGTQFHSLCFCGSPTMDKFQASPEEDCFTRCLGNMAENCGGHWRLSVYDTRGRSYWLGASDSESEGTWRWYPSKERLSYTDWMYGEPNNQIHDGMVSEDCMSLYSDTRIGRFKWNDENCGERLHFICEKRAERL